MGTLDVHWEKLRNYQGINPCPADFDQYWARALAKLDSQSLEYTLEKADFEAPGVECYHLWFTGVGNARLHAKFMKPMDMLQQSAYFEIALYFRHKIPDTSMRMSFSLVLAILTFTTWLLVLRQTLLL